MCGDNCAGPLSRGNSAILEVMNSLLRIWHSNPCSMRMGIPLLRSADVLLARGGLRRLQPPASTIPGMWICTLLHHGKALGNNCFQDTLSHVAFTLWSPAYRPGRDKTLGVMGMKYAVPM